MNDNSHGLRLGLAGILALLAACGGGGSDAPSPTPTPVPAPIPPPPPPPPPPPSGSWTNPPPPRALPAAGTEGTGIFRDANVEGMNYVSGTLSGSTGADGRFRYIAGQSVTFSVGAVELGSIRAAPFMTPMYLPTDLNSSLATQIDNRLRFLQMLDVDGNPENGILISASVRTRAETWAPIDFTTSPTSLATALATIRADAQSADGGTHTLPSADTARAHFARSVWCTYSGVYRGLYSGGGDNGIVALVSYGPSLIHAVAYSKVERDVVLFQNITPPGLSLTPDFTATEIGGTATVTADYDTPDIITGNWSIGTASGAFLAARAVYNDLPVYRIAGSAFPTQLFFNFEIDAANQVTGIVVDLDVAGTGEPVEVTGTLAGTSFNVTSANNTFSITNGTFNPAASPGSHQLNGTLRDNRHSRDVPLTVPACRLN